jgi:hypothetical protein
MSNQAYAEALARHLAEWLCARARERSQLRGLLFGRVDPRRLYEALAAPAMASRFPEALASMG